jgi:hypothetical protein
MSLNDEDLKRLFRSYIAFRIPENREGCPSLEKILSFFESPTRTRKKMKIIDHITKCSACAREFEFLLELQRSQYQMFQRAQMGKPVKPSAFSWPSLLRGIGPFSRLSTVVIGAIFIIASAIIISQKWGHIDSTRTTASTLTLIQPSQKNPGSLPLIFKWEPMSGADYYSLEIFDEALMPVWKCPEIHSPYFVMPEASSSWLKFDRAYFWMVVAYHNNEKLTESGLVRFLMILKNH